MGRLFAVLVGVVPAGDYRTVIVVVEYLVIDGDHHIYGGVQFGAQTIDVHGGCFKGRETENFFVVVLLFGAALDDFPRRIVSLPFFWLPIAAVI